MPRGARLLLIALCACAAAAQARAAEPAQAALFNLVSLSAQAEREVPNDTLSAVLAAEAEGSDPAALADGVNRSMREALRLAQGYHSVKARSLNYQTWPVYDKSRIVRWRVRQELRLESHDFAPATELIGKLQGGAQTGLHVTSLTFALSAEVRRQTENALIAEALAAFHERAAIVRDAEKATGYRVKELQIGGSGAQQRYYAPASRAAMLSSAAPAAEPGSSTLQLLVSGTIQLQ